MLAVLATRQAGTAAEHGTRETREAREAREARETRGAREARERGAVLVEAAIIIPLVLLLVFGALEYSFAFKESGTVESAARAGARTASANPKGDEWETDTAVQPISEYGLGTREAVASVVEGIGSGEPLEMWIYRADPTTGDPAGGGSVEDGSCSIDCVGWAWDGDGFDTALSGGAAYWDRDEQDACPTTADHIGIYVKARYEFFTGLFSDGRDLESRAVMRLEPFVNGPCGAGGS